MPWRMLPWSRMIVKSMHVAPTRLLRCAHVLIRLCLVGGTVSYEATFRHVLFHKYVRDFVPMAGPTVTA